MLMQTIMNPTQGLIPVTSSLYKQTFETDYVYKTTKDENDEYVKDNNGLIKKDYFCETLNPKTATADNGDIVTGTYKFVDYQNLRFGYNKVRYSFEPDNQLKYTTIVGEFYIKYIYDIPVKIQSNSLKLCIVSSNYYYVVNGKKYNSKNITGLELNTKYKIEIYQKANEYLSEDTLLWTTTVKTKPEPKKTK
jgi:hypothetical protein